MCGGYSVYLARERRRRPKKPLLAPIVSSPAHHPPCFHPATAALMRCIYLTLHMPPKRGITRSGHRQENSDNPLYKHSSVSRVASRRENAEALAAYPRERERDLVIQDTAKSPLGRADGNRQRQSLPADVLDLNLRWGSRFRCPSLAKFPNIQIRVCCGERSSSS